ncbi:hypothetical protein [Nocardia sp. BSTN01]|uniref:hypothetical protein n=1 Tax=Nocardia sp. BSTN01 TaxID=2783665 RepID=UPI001E3A3354|nr:hypothetical protein [Nocardia sp. BSTN01]
MPAGVFWATTAYNITDGTMPETDQLLKSTNGYYDIPPCASTAPRSPSTTRRGVPTIV